MANCPGKNSIAVAELAFGLILALDRRIPDNVADLRAGKWNKKEYSKAAGLHGRTLGLLGFGNIGQEMAKRAQAFGMNIAVWSEIGVETDRSGVPIDLPMLVRLRPSTGSPLEPLVRVYNTPEEVAENCDILSVHLALERQDARPRQRRRARQAEAGRVLRQHRARRGGRLRGARAGREGTRPARGARRLRQGARRAAWPTSTTRCSSCPNVYGTHHIGASTDQAQEAIAAETVRIVKTYVETGRVLNVVNLSRQTPAKFVLVVRHKDKPGVLADVFAALRDREGQRAGDREHRLHRARGVRGAHQRRLADRPRRCLQKMTGVERRHPRRAAGAARRPGGLVPPRPDAEHAVGIDRTVWLQPAACAFKSDWGLATGQASPAPTPTLMAPRAEGQMTDEVR